MKIVLSFPRPLRQCRVCAQSALYASHTNTSANITFNISFKYMLPNVKSNIGLNATLSMLLSTFRSCTVKPQLNLSPLLTITNTFASSLLMSSNGMNGHCLGPFKWARFSVAQSVWGLTTVWTTEGSEFESRYGQEF
jgi:hypothetical protein